MDSFQDYNQTLEPQSRLSSLFLILIFTLLASGTALVVLRQIDSYHRDQIYLATESTLPHHKISAATTTKHSNIMTPVADESNWKTYRDKAYGVEFSYDQNKWVVEHNKSNDSEFGYVINILDKVYGHDGPGIRGISIATTKYLNIDEFERSIRESKDLEILDLKQFKSNTGLFWKFVNLKSTLQFQGDASDMFFNFYIENNNKILSIGGSSDVELKLAESIIQTFKFLNK